MMQGRVQSVNLRLMPANGSAQPALANVTLVELTATLHQQIGGVLQALSRRHKADAR